MRDAYWKYVSNIFTFENDSSDPDTPKPEKIKKFWSFVKSLKKDAFGIASLRENGILKTDTKKKTNVCNRQFQSAFTREGDSDPPSKGASPFSPMGDITVDPKGVAKLLDGLNVHKAPSPDGLNARVLKECSNEISPILALIFNESLAEAMYQMSGDKLMFLQSLKKGEKYDAANYRPVSLTCIRCKTLDGAVNRGHTQTDLIIKDFAKAFDKVPHRRLLHKLDKEGPPTSGSTHGSLGALKK